MLMLLSAGLTVYKKIRAIAYTWEKPVCCIQGEVCDNSPDTTNSSSIGFITGDRSLATFIDK
jgi:hypothetical protein